MSEMEDRGEPTIDGTLQKSVNNGEMMISRDIEKQ